MPSAGTAGPEIRKGLAGVYADTTAISMVNPETNSLTYRMSSTTPSRTRSSPCGGDESDPGARTKRPPLRRSEPAGAGDTTGRSG